MPAGDVLWSPAADAWDATRMGRFLAASGFDEQQGWETARRWSVTDLDDFWGAVWRDAGLGEPPVPVLAHEAMPGARWCPDARLNVAEHLLRWTGNQPAIIARSDTRVDITLSRDVLRGQVARVAAGFRELGVGPGDRVVGYLPNVPEAVIAFLATASIGAIWSSCAPEFGTTSVIDRVEQIEPTLLLAADGYRYGDREIPRVEEVAAIRAALPTLEATVVLGHLTGHPKLADFPGARDWATLGSNTAPLVFEPVAFDHPLYILYSSGTTGRPKAIVHGHGGILLEH
ncbi:MAG: AMP-binding protein, partial [Nitriliruptorales bacterium]|nr:AMP-binding protein [Nitriliruptorales bacterium]